ncbi:hypothetical protein N7465_000456 [Penicillium sp. CMV-2018d]|nr:hypothetical protein N7465_000456 [Penicillium sp. CMV-2018d]
MTLGHGAKVLGEAKVPWIAEHCLDNLVDEFEDGDTEQTLRHALAKPYSVTSWREMTHIGYHVGLLALTDSAFNTGTGMRNQGWTRNA